MDSKEKLHKIAQEIKDCQKCPLFQTANNSVPGEGDEKAKILFIGEAPGYYEDQQGQPFVGRAGKLLDSCLEEIGLARNKVFITNILKHRPPNNRDPLPDEITACRKWLHKQVEIINPEVIATLGRFSMNKFLPGVFISQTHGQARWANFNNKKYLIFPLYHPAAALRNGNIMQELKKDFAKLKELVDNKEKVDILQQFEKEKEKPKKKEKEQLTLL